ncbi:MAG: glycosyltransferase family 39 protein [Candidatus Woesearchaeota archaeon]|nr:glycosyltransferase family 39 protein [Candidatus Aenigmarchaeota archaeon]
MAKKQEKQKKDEEIEFEIKNPELLILSIFLLALFILQLRVTLTNPIAFGDEGYHGMLQRYIGLNVDYPKWHPYYSNPLGEMGVSDNPLWHLLGASLFMIFRSDIVIKVLPPFIGVICVGYISYFLGKKIFNNKTIAFFTAVITVTTPSVVTYSVLNYKDAMMTFYFTFFVLSFVLYLKNNDKKFGLLAGIFGGLLVLGKTSGYAMVPTIFGIFLLYEIFLEKNLKVIIKFLPIFVLIILVTSGFFLRNLILYKTPICSAFIPFFSVDKCNLTKIKYEPKYQMEGRTVQVGTEMTPFKLGMQNYFEFAYGYLWFLPLFFFLGLFYFTTKREKERILTLLVFISFLPIYYIAFKSRAEDTARWIMPLVPIMALIASIYLKNIYDFLEKNIKLISIIFFLFIIFISFMNFNQKIKTMNLVKKFSPEFLQACDWVKKNTPKDARLGAIIYMPAAGYNCDRNIAAGGPDVVLSQNNTLMLSVLHMQNATHLFIQKSLIAWDDAKLSERHPISFVRYLENNPTDFVKVYETGPNLNQCMSQGGCDGIIIYELNYTGKNLIPVEKLI